MPVVLNLTCLGFVKGCSLQLSDVLYMDLISSQHLARLVVVLVDHVV